jgi:oxygen-dependent protoporphyrinogen oxidase
VFVGGALQPDLLEHSDEELIQLAREELAELIGLQGDPIWAAVRRWERAMPQYHVGHLERVAAVETRLKGLPGLEIAGNGLHGVGVGLVVGAARRAAERLASELETADV